MKQKPGGILCLQGASWAAACNAEGASAFRPRNSANQTQRTEKGAESNPGSRAMELQRPEDRGLRKGACAHSQGRSLRLKWGRGGLSPVRDLLSAQLGPPLGGTLLPRKGASCPVGRGQGNPAKLRSVPHGAKVVSSHKDGTCCSATLQLQDPRDTPPLWASPVPTFSDLCPADVTKPP